jgi:hypothetical protein
MKPVSAYSVNLESFRKFSMFLFPKSEIAFSAYHDLHINQRGQMAVFLDVASRATSRVNVDGTITLHNHVDESIYLEPLSAPSRTSAHHELLQDLFNLFHIRLM